MNVFFYKWLILTLGIEILFRIGYIVLWLLSIMNPYLLWVEIKRVFLCFRLDYIFLIINIGYLMYTNLSLINGRKIDFCWLFEAYSNDLRVFLAKTNRYHSLIITWAKVVQFYLKNFAVNLVRTQKLMLYFWALIKNQKKIITE